MKTSSLLLALMVISASITCFNAFACGGGQDIVLNDDTVLLGSGRGLRYPISEPQKDVALDIKEYLDEIENCERDVFYNGGGLDAVIYGSKCNSRRIGAVDSQGNHTHWVTMSLIDAGSTARYDVCPRNSEGECTEPVKKYSARLGTRDASGCGLSEVTE